MKHKVIHVEVSVHENGLEDVEGASLEDVKSQLDEINKAIEELQFCKKRTLVAIKHICFRDDRLDLIHYDVNK